MANGLFEQLSGVGEVGEVIPIVSSLHLAAMVREVQRGEVTGGQASAALGLTAQSVIELTALVAEVNLANINAQEVTDVFDLVQSGVFYATKVQTKTRLGI